MTSAAYLEWASKRRSRIDELMSAHTAVGGTGRGRRWRTQQLNWALTLRLAAEFQGFTRDLHDQAADHCIASARISNASLSDILSQGLTRDRKLDKGNASPGGLGLDFFRIGLALWPALELKDRRTKNWNAALDTLNLARNAIAHDDHQKFAELRSRGKDPITLAIVKGWRTSLDSLATTMDDVVGDYLGRLLGGTRPW